jgi:Mg2+ and Co2+ transporter CorA
MVKDRLLEHIEEAREELLAARDLDATDRDIVGHLLTDVVEHLTEEGEGQTQDHLMDRIRQHITRLEVDHPKLASMLDRTANLLASLGI